MFADERPPTTTIRSTSRAVSSVSSWRRIVTGQTVFTILSSWLRETMNAASFSNFQGGWVDWLISAIFLRRGICVPVLFLVDDDRVRGEAEQADDLRVLRRPEQHDRVALLDELHDLLLLLDHPGAGAVDDLEAALAGALHHVRPDAVGADDDRRAAVDVVERVDGLDAERLEVPDHALVVHDLARACASPCRRRWPPWPCRSPRARRSRTRFAWRSGSPRRCRYLLS